MSKTSPIVKLNKSPQVSIVTIVKNNENGLKETLKSISIQEYENWQLTIVVGESFDATLEHAKQYAVNEKRAKVVIQPDSGIYEAMNLGTRKISRNSEYVIYMNAGDQFNNSKAIKKLVHAIVVNRVGVVVGGYKIQNGKTYPQTAGNLSESRFAFARRGGCHQSMIYSVKAIKDLNYYNLDFKIASDHDLTLRVLRKSGGYRIPDIVSIVEGNGISDNNLSRLHREKQEIRARHFRRAPWIILIGKFWKNAYLAKQFVNVKFRKP